MSTQADTGAADGLVLIGLDGSNSLAFLAALGTLRTLARAWPDREVKMAWMEQAGAWRPVVRTGALPFDGNAEKDRIVLDALEDALAAQIDDHPVGVLSESTKTDPRATREFFLDRANSSTATARESADWLSAMSSDLAPAATSQLQTARRDYFYGNLSSIIAVTKRADLQRCLFAPWDYADGLDNQSLHIDPTEDRRHAYQWHQPTQDPTRSKRGGMLGANRLAIEAFPFFQSFASGDKLSTRGFSGNRADSTRWTWPVWSGPLGCDELGSLLSLPALQVEAPDAAALRGRGIAAAFRCRRILVGKTPNFTPATSVF